MVVNAKIGIKEFFAMQGDRLSPPQHLFMNIDEPWENGAGYARLGRKGAIETILTWSEFDTYEDAIDALVEYELLMNALQTISIKVGDAFHDYENYKILHVKDATENPYSPVVSNGGNYLLVVEWTVQQVTGDW